MEHRRYVHGGTVCACAAGGSGRGPERRAVARESGLYPTGEDLSVGTPCWRGKRSTRCWSIRCRAGAPPWGPGAGYS